MTTDAYRSYIELVKERRSIRKFKPDPIPDEYVSKVLEAARWAMSGGNAQPWEFIVVKKSETRKKIINAYKEHVDDYNYWMEQQRVRELRHLAMRAPTREHMKRRILWDAAPVIIVVLGDGRRQWAAVYGGHTMGRHMSHLTDGLANACQIIHLAAASLGIGSQWVTLHIQEPFKRILDVPDIMTLHSMIPLGYPAVKPVPSYRRDLKETVHYEKYDMSKHMSNEDIIEYLRNLRNRMVKQYT